MDEHFNYNSITVSTKDGMNHVQFSVERTAENQRETVSLLVIIPVEPSHSLREVQKAATRRAIEILQASLLEESQAAHGA